MFNCFFASKKCREGQKNIDDERLSVHCHFIAFSVQGPSHH